MNRKFSDIECANDLYDGDFEPEPDIKELLDEIIKSYLKIGKNTSQIKIQQKFEYLTALKIKVENYKLKDKIRFLESSLAAAKKLNDDTSSDLAERERTFEHLKKIYHEQQSSDPNVEKVSLNLNKNNYRLNLELIGKEVERLQLLIPQPGNINRTLKEKYEELDSIKKKTKELKDEIEKEYQGLPPHVLEAARKLEEDKSNLKELNEKLKDQMQF